MVASFSVHIKVAPDFPAILTTDTAEDRIAVGNAIPTMQSYEDCTRVELIYWNMALGSTTCSGTYIVRGKLTNRNTGTSRYVEVPDRGCRYDAVMYKLADGVPSAEYSLGRTFIFNTGGGAGKNISWNIPQGIMPPNDGDWYYVRFQNYGQT
jgi:hypothetical protein